MPDGLVCLTGLKRRIEVCHLEGMMPCLVSNGQQVSMVLDKVCNSRVLQGVELELRRKVQGLLHLQSPEIPEMLGRAEVRARPEIL